MPSAAAFVEAVQFPESAFTDPVLAAAEPDVTPLGLPRGYSGAFAIVFRLTNEREVWAAKCFFNPSDDLAERFDAISRHLAEHPVEALAPFTFLRAGIRVDGQTWPVVRMPWQAGRSLVAHVRDCLDQPPALLALADALGQVQQALEAAQVAHGDLQHGNLLVEGSALAPVVRLIDLDAAYVPALRRKSSLETGHRNYAHPDRSADLFGPALDRFSFQVLDASLRALAVRPDLWPTYHTGENLIFSAADFFDPEGSALLADLRADPSTVPLAETMHRASLLPPDRVPPLGETVEQPLRQRRSLAGREGESGNGSSRVLAWSVGFISLVLLALAWADIVSIGAAVVVAIVVGVIALGAAWRAYRRHPHTRRTQRLMAEAATLERLIADLDADRERLVSDRDQLTGNLDQMRADRLERLRAEALRDRLKHHLIGEVSAAGVPHKAVVRMKLVNIRNAWHATPDRVAQAMELGDETRARIGLWRSGLIQTYRDELPDTLTPGEERRLARERTHRIEELDADLRRIGERRLALEQERASLSARTEAHKPLSFAAFCRLAAQGRALPATAPQPAKQVEASAPEPVHETDAPWWQA
jgi:hypothetical protein